MNRGTGATLLSNSGTTVGKFGQKERKQRKSWANQLPLLPFIKVSPYAHVAISCAMLGSGLASCYN